MIKCATPPISKAKYIDRSIKLSPNSSSDSDSSSSESASLSRSPSPSRSFVEFNQFEHFDKSDDEDDQYRTDISHTQEISLKIRYCDWRVQDFSTCSLNKEGFINSKIYSAGVSNEFQWFFRIERFKQKKEVYYGVYVCVITHDESQAKMEFRAYITELKGYSYKLATTKNFPKKDGMEFLGFLRKSHIRDNVYWYYRMIPDDNLKLSFRIYIQFKKSKNKLVDDLKDIWKTKKYTDAVLVVKGEEIPVHKTILTARSPTFAQIFKDNNSSKVYIDDFEPEVMEELLRYMYTGRIKKLIKYLKDYSAAANKYNLKDLREICDKTTKSYTS
ncbi:speckle-type POZ protein-like isoform X2 [Phymastichus coffea]|nr:speckle-type POZ protein-like isoform X2 [Phymastichus coffea]XP_058790486.1 speckle-type POZ protein-like isoform X2 [Phymastichus coffea]